MRNKDVEIIDHGFKIMCPFCNEVLPPTVEDEISGTSGGCDTCGYGAGGNVTVEVFCSKCKRLIYKKDGWRSD